MSSCPISPTAKQPGESGRFTGNSTIRVIAVVGPSGCGKTELICRLLEFLPKKLKVAVVKHSHKAISADQPGKDTWRFRKAGAPVVALAAPQLIQVTQTLEEDPSVTIVLAALPADVELILVEGYKRGPLPKLVFIPEGTEFSEATYAPPVLAYISDQALPTSLPIYSREQVVELAGLILQQV